MEVRVLRVALAKMLVIFSLAMLSCPANNTRSKSDAVWPKQFAHGKHRLPVTIKHLLNLMPKKIHIALYSPGIVGLGHLHRNLIISQVLADSTLQSVNLMITEASEARVFGNSMPPGMDCVTLPGLSKSADGICKPRYLDLPLKEVISLRARTIRAALKEFKPDLFIVDNLPRGAYRELDPTLKYLKSAGRTRCILGLRDVLDEPWSVHRDWL